METFNTKNLFTIKNLNKKIKIYFSKLLKLIFAGKRFGYDPYYTVLCTVK